MLPSPAEAAALIARHLPPSSTEDCPLTAAAGRILRQTVTADRPLPPYDRVTMDGYAVNSADPSLVADAALRVTGFQAAGMRALALTETGTVIEIATGATMPTGADAVVPYEETTRDGPHVRLHAGVALHPGRNVHARGSDFPAGAPLLQPGVRLTGREIAVAATCGYATLRVAARPSVALIATGDELVEVDAPHLSPHQIRRSNDHALHAALFQSHAAARVERFHLRDHRTEIDQALRRILAEFDVVIVTGGISKGKLDHLPQALNDLGVTTHLRGVAQRPGKPLWFGTTSRRTPVFGLPGNPVSTYTCFHRYVLPALRLMAGAFATPPASVVLAAPITFPPRLAYLLPVKLTSADDGRLLAQPAPFNTSGDLGGLLDTDGFVELPAEEEHFAVGRVVPLWRWT